MKRVTTTPELSPSTTEINSHLFDSQIEAAAVPVLISSVLAKTNLGNLQGPDLAAAACECYGVIRELTFATSRGFAFSLADPAAER